MTQAFNLQDHGITVAEIHRNLPPSLLYEHAMRYEKDANIAENGALVAYSGAKTGRSPKDKRFVKHPDSEADVWWGKVNIPIQPVPSPSTASVRSQYPRPDLLLRWVRRLGLSDQDTRHLFAGGNK